MLAFIFIAAFVAGLFMFLLPQASAKVQRLGEIFLFSSLLAFLITIAPTVEKLLHS
jgi:hypothetical protein